MEMISSMLADFTHSLRFEITFAVVLAVLWCIAHLSSNRQKPRRSGKLAPHSPLSKKQGDTASAGKERAGRGGAWTNTKPDCPSTRALVQLGSIDDIDPALLCDVKWLVPQVVHMCRTEVRKSMQMYRAALKAGLKLEDMPVEACQHFFEALVTSAVRTGKMDDTMQLLRDLRSRGPGVYTSLFCSVLKLSTSKHLFTEGLAVYDLMAEDPNFALTDKSIWSCLLFCAIETRADSRCNFFFDNLKACGPPSQKDYGNMMRLASLQGDWRLSLKLIQDMQETGQDVDSVVYNTSLATCVGAGQVDEAKSLLEAMEKTGGIADVITYNTLMKGYAKTGCMDQCFEIFEHLKSKGIVPSQVTYGILLDGFINDNELERAATIFNSMMKEGGTMNTVLFTTLIKGFVRAGDVDQAMKVYEQMRLERNVTPDLITFSILIKANCDADRLEEALRMLGVMTSLNLRPDEVVFNNLLAGSARQGNAELGKRLYADMVSSGIRPSNATFSILIRFFQQCKNLEDAVDMLRNEPVKHKVEPEPRLFLQLIQSCIRERQGRRAVEVYQMMAERSAPTAPTHSSMMTTCVKLNMFDTASEILAIAADKRFRVDGRDANALLDSAMKKRKTQVAGDIAASMAKLGLTVDAKLQLLPATCQ